MKKVVVTGATGFLGKSLTTTLLEANTVVYGIGTKQKELHALATEFANFIPICASFEDYSKLPDLITDEIDVFYHFAWAGGFTTALSDYELQLNNAKYSADTVKIAHQLGIKKYIYANTYNQYEILNFLRTKDFTPRSTCIYATAKTAANLIGKTIASGFDMTYCVGLIPMPYGIGNHSKQLVNIVLDSLNKGISPKLIDGNSLYDIVHVKDIANAFIAIGNYGKNGCEYYIGHRKLKTFKEWMEEIRDAVMPSVDLKFGEYPDLQSINYSDIDLSLLYRDTGFECEMILAEEMPKVAEWLKRNH